MTIINKLAILFFLLYFANSIGHAQDSDQAVYSPWQSGYYVTIDLHDYLLPAEKEAILATGITLVDYVPTKKYIAHVPAGFVRSSEWQQFPSIKSVRPISADQKVDATCENYPLPDYAKWHKEEYRYQVTFYANVKPQPALASLQEQKVTLIKEHTTSRVYEIACSPKQLATIAALPYVQYIELIDEPGVPENNTGRTLHRANAIDTDFPSLRQYNGSGISVQMQDDGGIGPHIDYTGRVPNQFSENFNPSDNHGDHVAGTIMGAGNLNPKAKGMADGADLYVYEYEPLNDSIVPHYDKYNIRITSTSYSNGCNRGYSSTARDHDMETRQLPELIHVFSAGNSNGQDCGYGAGDQWGNITGGHKVGKNVIAVANLNANDGIASSSSRGPAHDGRIKPDISAQGTNVLSTLPDNNYASFTGTSMACPGVSGSLAQLYQAYLMMEGHLPPSALVKAVVLNSAEDLGNPGPDFIFGWGRINNRKALQLLEDHAYYADTLDQQDTIRFSLTIPANIVQGKVMLYWHDYEAAAGATTALVNDLDLTITDPSNKIHLPYTLNTFPHPDSLNSAAKPGIDSLNNVEQIVLNNPTPGVYTVQVVGRAVPLGPQDFYLVYQLEEAGITLTYPIGGESFAPNQAELIRWDASADTGSFMLDYSLDSGATWQPLGTANAGSRGLAWVVPDTASHAMVRINRGAHSSQSTVPFSILRAPTNLRIDTACCDYYSLSWNPVQAANAYIIYQLGNKYMEPIDTVYQSFYTMSPPQTTTWMSVSALLEPGINSERALAIEVMPDMKANCILPNNATISSIVSPRPGLIPACFTPPVTIQVKNNSLDTLYNLPVHYENEGQVVAEAIDTLLPLQSTTYTFTQLPAFTTSGNNILQAWVSASSDKNTCDDSLTVSNTVHSGSLVTLPYEEDFRSFANCDIEPNCVESTCQLSGIWYNEPNAEADDIDWRTDNGGTFSNGTGPLEDYVPGTIFGKYVYIEASGDCTNQEAIMTSTCIDLTTAAVPELSFYYHMWGPSMGQLRVQILQDNEWKTEFIRVGNQGNEWIQGKVDLTPYREDTIAIRFIGITGADYQSDLALDYIQLYDLQPTETPTIISKERMRLQPNPASGLVNIQLPTPTAASSGNLMVYDRLGRMVYQMPVSQATNVHLTTQSWPAGHYVVQYTTPQHTLTEALIIQH